MIKKILMISENDIASNVSLGVTKKILGQYKAFQNLGYDVYNLCLENGEGVLIHGEEKKVVLKSRIKDYFTVAKLLSSVSDRICQELQIDCCYVRFTLADWAFMNMIKKLHKLCKVVVEIPTYPYDNIVAIEKSFITSINFFQDKKNRKSLKKYIDKIIVFGDQKNIYGIPCINICNGIDVSKVEYLGDQLNYSGNEIHLFTVAVLSSVHGIDRIINSLDFYYQIKDRYYNVYLDIVGDGPEKSELQKLVDEKNLKKYILFHGRQYGENLQEYYIQSQIGIACFGAHRVGFEKTAVLKAREYCSVGLPFISSSKDDAFPEDKCPFYKLFPSNDDPIDIEQVIEFYEYIKAHPEIHRQMRTYAEENLTWEKQLKKVMESIEQ